MWGILPHYKLRRYRSILQLPKEVEAAWLQWMGADFTTAFAACVISQRWVYLQKGYSTIKCRRIGGRLEVGIRPLEDIATFLSTLTPREGRQIRFRAEDSEWPFTSTTDKMSQLEFYYAWEGTSHFRQC
eukprot:992961-Rhodomonas_salina.2